MLASQAFRPHPAYAFAALCLVGISPLASGQNRMLEEVVVTAQKRAQDAQDVPIGITALSAEMIENAGITNTTDIVKLAPSLTFGQGNNKQNSGFSVRGVGTLVFSIGVENSVAVVIDDVSTVQAGQSLANLYDIESIEVLRGPQSTLFGKSASAGLINVRTKAPSEQLESSVELTATDDDQRRIAGSVSGPLTDALGFRLSGHWDELDGYYDNLTYGGEVNEHENFSLRGKLRWDLGESTQLDLNAYYSQDETSCCNLSWETLDPDARLFGLPLDEPAAGITVSDENRDVRRDDITDSEVDNTGINGRLAFDMGEFTFTSITAYDNWQYDNIEDVDFSDVDVLGFFTGGTQQGGFRASSAVETDFVSQEFRLASPLREDYDYLLGFFYSDADTDRSFRRNQGLPILPSSWDATAGTENMAVFGTVNWRFAPNLELTAGLRWNSEEVTIDYVNNLATEDGTANNSDSDSELLGNLSLQFTPREDVMLYARYAQGYKGQAYNVVTGFTQEDADNPVAPETSDLYELGFRSTLWDQRLQLNATLFYTEYTDYQAQNTRISPEGEFINKLRNVGELETSGFEVEARALVGENLTLNLSSSYLEAEIKEFDGAPCYPGQTEADGCVDDVQNLEGSTLPNAPEWKYNLGADYHLSLSNLPFYGFIRLSYTWQDEVGFSLSQNPLTRQDSYGTADLQIGINEKASDLYRVTLFVNNIADESFSNAKADIRQLYGSETAIIQNLPRNSQRYYGIRVKLQF
ncbi:MAG: TonB-dependent receptor [Halioglobus sp.]